MLQEVSLAGLEDSACYKKWALQDWKTQYVTRSEPCWTWRLNMLQEVSTAGPEGSVCYKKWALLDQKTWYVDSQPLKCEDKKSVVHS